MTTNRVRWLAALTAAALAACSPGATTERQAEGGAQVPDTQERGDQKPRLLLLSSLPILFGPAFPTNDEFFIDGPPDGEGNVLQKALEGSELVGIATTSAEELAKGRVLLMAHPRAQTAENLVALDAWVRSGGRLLLLADPAFAIERGPPTLGGNYPPPFFADTGLLGHWGLLLDGPLTHGTAQLELSGEAVEVRSPGRFRKVGGDCALEADGFLADCAIGEGRALLLADADFIIAEGEQGDANRAALAALIDRLRD